MLSQQNFHFIVYKNFPNEELANRIFLLLRKYRCFAAEERTELVDTLYEVINEMLEIAVDHGFCGNIWHSYLTWLLVYSENAYSRACEITGEVEGSINAAADHDFALFRELFAFDWRELEEALQSDCVSILYDFKNVDSDRKIFNRRIRDRIEELSVQLAKAEDVAQFHKMVVGFYKEFGVGKFGLHKAFCVRGGGSAPVVIQPITNVSHIHFSDLVGYELQKKKLCDNTEAFVQGKKANNCLLFGDAGTGKSSSVKALLNEYFDQGLRMIEVYKHQFQDLPNIIAQIKNRNYKFIIYMDDLSFEEFEIEYKYLKAIIEGGLEKKPDNVLIYATSNRRHLIQETFRDKEGRRDALHASDTVQEKLSLSSRFGVSIFFVSPTKKEFETIVKTLAERYGVHLPEEELYLEANKWELSHGGLSGRTAQQFIDHLLGTRSAL